MELRPALTTLLVQFPPSATGIAGMVGGFLGSGLTGISLGRLEQGASAVVDGMVWGSLLSGLVTATVGGLLLLGLRRARAGRGRWIQAMVAQLLCAPAAALGVLLGAGTGLVASGAVPPSRVLQELALGAPHLWISAILPLTLCLAAGLGVLSSTRPRA